MTQPRRLFVALPIALLNVILSVGLMGATIAAGDAHRSVPLVLGIAQVTLGLPLAYVLSLVVYALTPFADWWGDFNVSLGIFGVTGLIWAYSVVWLLGHTRERLKRSLQRKPKERAADR
jgi:hypothetical protein